MKISLIIPAFNEEETIGETVLAYREYLSKLGEYEIIVVNDGSIDNTLDKIRNMEGVICVSYAKNRGKGYAVRRGVFRATGDYIFFTDADLSYSPLNIGRALEIFKKSHADIVVGERNKKREGYSFVRRIISSALCRILKHVLKISSEDSQCGFKGFKKRTARQIFSRAECDGFGFDFEVLAYSKEIGLQVQALRVEFVHRECSKVRVISDSIRMLKEIRRLAFSKKLCEKVNYEKRRSKVFWLTFFLLALFRLSYLGYSYTPYLDDWVQYVLYPSLDKPVKSVLTGGAGVLFTRPLAGLMDFFVWSKFNGNLGLAVFILTLAYACSGMIFYKAFERMGIRVTPIFLVFYTLAPINIEGTYWISASSRIAISMLLVAISVWFLLKKRNILFWIFNIFAMCFYEQTAVLAFALPFFILMREKKFKLAAVPIINLSAIGMYYLCFAKMSNNNARMGNLEISDMPKRIWELTRQSFEMWGDAQYRLIFNGFKRGVERIAFDGSLGWVLVLSILSVLFIWSISKKTQGKSGAKEKIVIGFFLGIVPLAPFLLSGESVLNFRNAVPSLLGVGLMLDGLISLIPYRINHALTGIVAVCFMVVGVSEVCDYETTARRDWEMAERIVDIVPDNGFDEVECSVLAPVRFEQNSPFNDHIISIRGSSWGITGMVRAVAEINK